VISSLGGEVRLSKTHPEKMGYCSGVGKDGGHSLAWDEELELFCVIYCECHGLST
jgi:hypothetical protein